MTDPPTCGHCLGPMQGNAYFRNHDLCHPDEGPDCYRLVTIYGHPTPHPDCPGMPTEREAIDLVFRDLDALVGSTLQTLKERLQPPEHGPTGYRVDTVRPAHGYGKFVPTRCRCGRHWPCRKYDRSRGILARYTKPDVPTMPGGQS